MKNAILLLLSCLPLMSCNAFDSKHDKQQQEQSKKVINGVSLVNTSYRATAADFEDVKTLHANWITTMPFGFVARGDDSVQYNNSGQWYEETLEGVEEIVNLAHEQGLSVMIKPHIWCMDGWVGDLEFSTEVQWQVFEKSYTAYILDFARLASSTDAEAFCIGVELKKHVTKRHEFWFQLIDKVRDVYKGPITYAANWDNYNNVVFWDKLDYIGVDAYFPVSEEKTPSVDSCYIGWQAHFNDLKLLSDSLQVPVLFTEFGYRNIDYCANKPWDDNQQTTFNAQAQANAYQALFNGFWNEPWFAGGFLWKWHKNSKNISAENDNWFTPQNKPAAAVISEAFKRSK